MDVVDLVIWIVIICIQLVAIFFFVFLLRKRQVWPLIMMGITGHGSLALKFLSDNGVEFAYSKKPITKIFWAYKDKFGKLRKNWQSITDVKHRLAGTSMPVHLCPFDTPTNISIVEKKDKAATAEELNEMLNYQYMQGVIDTRKMMQKPALGMNFDYRILIIIGVLALVAFLAWPQISNAMAG